MESWLALTAANLILRRMLSQLPQGIDQVEAFGRRQHASQLLHMPGVNANTRLIKVRPFAVRFTIWTLRSFSLPTRETRPFAWRRIAYLRGPRQIRTVGMESLLRALLYRHYNQGHIIAEIAIAEPRDIVEDPRADAAGTETPRGSG